MLSRLLVLSAVSVIRLMSFLAFFLVVLCSTSSNITEAASQQFTVSPGNLDFQTVAIGQQATLLFHVHNTGSTNLQIDTVSASGSQFHVSGPSLPVSLVPSQIIDFKMTFEPTAIGKTSALLEIRGNLQPVQVFTLSGTGKLALTSIEVSPSSLNFGVQKLNALSVKAVTVFNNGDEPCTISGVTVLGSGFDYARVSPGLTIAPKQKAVLQVSFRPLSIGIASGKLAILSKNLDSPASLPLAGSGVSSSPEIDPRTSATAALAKSASTKSTAQPALTSSSSALTVHLQWAASASPVSGYEVYRGSVSGGPYTERTTSPVAGLAFDDTSVSAGTTYYYVVTALNSNGEQSAFSNEASATTPSSSGSTTTPPTTTPPSPSTPTAPSSGSSSLTTQTTRNGSAVLNGTALRLTNTGANLAGSGWFPTPVNVQSFSSDFTFQLSDPTTNAIGNGIAFVIQNAGTNALGPAGGGLGYGPDHAVGATPSANSPIGKSVAIKFDTVNNAGEGVDSTGLYINGASPTVPALPLGNGVNLRAGDVFAVHMSYSSNTLTMTITDTRNTAEGFSTSWPINIPSTVGANMAYIGFTGATGSSVANQDILTWSFSNSQTVAKTPIVYSSTALMAVSSGPTFRTFTYSAFPDSTGTILDATAAQQNVTFTVKVPVAGTYDVKLSYKQYPSRGISQLTINGATLGSPLDQYLPEEGFATVDYGSFSFAAAGNYSFKFTILGKNANSSGYDVSFDEFTLTPQ